MLGKIFGAMVGNQLASRNNGLRGAAMGALTMGAMRRMGPLGLVLGGAYVAKKMYDRRRVGI